MKAIIALMILIPTLCFGGTNLIYDQTIKTNAEAKFSDASKTAVEFSLSGLTTETVNLKGREFIKILPLIDEIADFGFTGEEGLPDLPVYSSMVIIPDQAGVRINILSSEYETYENIDIAPAQPWVLESGGQVAPFAMDESFYEQDSFYPEQLVAVGEPMIMRDFRFVQTLINPVQYNPAAKQLRVYTHVNYELIYEGTDNRNMKTRRNNNISEAFLPIYQHVFSNAEAVLTDFEPIRGGYLIISPNNYNFSDTIQTLARWKHLKGYQTVVTRSDEITPSGTPTYSQVYNYILAAYQNWDTPPDYIMIVGDMDQRIPDYSYSGYTSDHQYTTVDGGDYISDIFIARMSIDNITELRTAMQKVLRYEKDPYVAEPGYWKRGLAVAGNIGAESPRTTVLWVRDLAIEHGYTQVDSVFDWGSGAPNLGTISTAINNGLSYVSYRGWAGSSGWYNPSWGTSNIGQLTNGWKMGIMASIVCGTGNYGADLCFGEGWIRYGSPTAPKGGPCFYGCTDGGTHTAWNNPNMVGFFWALFEQDIYHFSQLMFMGKMKIFEAFPRYTGSGGYVNKYFNTYNCLGDPELAVRTEIPQQLTANYPAQIPIGANFLTVNVGSAGEPLESAYVNLVKGYGVNEEIFVGGYTDAGGSITLNFNNTIADTIFVTVTARDYIPHIGFCLSVAQPIALGADTLIISDDDSGGSSGNSDGRANPGETLELGIRLHNYGNSINATGVNGILTSANPGVTIINGNRSYPNINIGNSALPTANFIIELSGDIPHGEYIPLNLAITANEGNWSTNIALDIISIKAIAVQPSYPGNPNNRLDPGETSDLVITFENGGGLDGRQISGQLSCSDSYITIVDGAGSFGNINIGQTGNNNGNPFRVSVGQEAYNGRNVNFTINFTADMSDMDDISFDRTFSLTIGSVNTFDPVGPDNYGYYMYDNTDMGYLNAPNYNWAEINPNQGGSGTRVNMRENDDASELITLPFDVQYYGFTYRHMIVSTNGFAAFDTIPYDVSNNYWHNWDNWPIPDPCNARAQISPFWDDLESTGSPTGIYTWHDQANGRFIIEWSGHRHARTLSPQTFEMIIYNADQHPTPTGDCEIVFQYNTVNNDDYSDDYSGPAAYSSVGFENWAQTDGLQYQYDNSYHPGAAVLQNGRAIKITTATGLSAPPDMSYDPTEFSLAAEPGDLAEARLFIENHGEGLLFYNISAEVIENLLGGGFGNEFAIISSLGSLLNKSGNDTPVINSKTEEFSGPYYPPVILDSGGPDNYGYTWIDSDEPGGPAYNWIDITSIGTQIAGLADESNLGPYPIGFDFNFYGNTFSTFRVCSNGYVSFTSTVNPYNNTTIPNTAEPNNLLSVYWDDLNFAPRGEAYYYNNGVDSCVISYIGVPHYSDDGLFTFQIILLGNGKIIYQYAEASGIDVNQETIGIENAGGTDGLQVCYNAAYVEPGLAIQFSAFPRWLSANPLSNIVNPNTSDTITIIANASDLEEAMYEGIIHIETNDLDYPSVEIPVHFNVFIPGDCVYIPGDINGDGGFTIADVTYGANYFKGVGSMPQDSCWNDSTNSWLYAAGDVNGNCVFLGSDISYLVAYFRGDRPNPGWCPQTPPPAQLQNSLNKFGVLKIKNR